MQLECRGISPSSQSSEGPLNLSGSLSVPALRASEATVWGKNCLPAGSLPVKFRVGKTASAARCGWLIWLVWFGWLIFIQPAHPRLKTGPRRCPAGSGSAASARSAASRLPPSPGKHPSALFTSHPTPPHPTPPHPTPPHPTPPHPTPPHPTPPHPTPPHPTPHPTPSPPHRPTPLAPPPSPQTLACIMPVSNPGAGATQKKIPSGFWWLGDPFCHALGSGILPSFNPMEDSLPAGGNQLCWICLLGNTSLHP